MSRNVSEQYVDAVVVGAGFAGLYQIYKLRELGLSTLGIDAAPSVGGTWFWNRYPGARTDSPAHLYQYWFSDELLEEWNWSERYPSQAEAERYLNYVADKFELRQHYWLETRVESAHWQPGQERWLVTTNTGRRVFCKFFVSCCGPLAVPVTPDYPGMDEFAGELVHTYGWPREGVDLRGKRVGVLGTGATGMQVIQTIAPEVAELTVFQRTANFAVPMKNWEFTDEEHREIRQRNAEVRERSHNTFSGFEYELDSREFASLPKEERQQRLEDLWADGSLRFWVANFQELFFDPSVNEEISEFVRGKIRPRIDDPAVAKKLLPTSHAFGAKRVPLENGYFETFNRDNVHLVDLRAEPIETMTPAGVRTAAGEYPLDVLILATGFNAALGAARAMDIRGRTGESLKELWHRDLRTTLGLQVHGYPNLFLTSSALSPSAGFCNAPTCIQQQVEWITRCIDYVHKQPRGVIEPTAEKEEEWVAHHDELAAATLVAQTDSWYTGANVNGERGRVVSYLGGVGAYRQICQDIEDAGYKGFEVT